MALLEEHGIGTETLLAIEAEVTDEIEGAAEEALAYRDRIPLPEQALYEGFSEGGVLIGLENRPI